MRLTIFLLAVLLGWLIVLAPNNSDWESWSHGLSKLDKHTKLQKCYNQVSRLSRQELIDKSGCQTQDCLDSFTELLVQDCLRRAK